MTQTIPQLLQRIARDHPGLPAQYSKDSRGEFLPTTFSRLYQEVLTFAAGLRSLGIKRGDHVGLVSDNRQEWLVTDLAILSLGAVDVPRGCDSMAGELRYILSFADCRTAFLENEAQLRKVLSEKAGLPRLETLVLFDADFDLSPHTAGLAGMRVLSYRDIMETGEALPPEEKDLVIGEIRAGAESDPATIIFTSGTTGEPKGVVISHLNFLHQVRGAPKVISPGPGDIWLCVLPVWHSFERIMQYIALGTASALAYSKPVGKIMLADFRKIRPTWMASVPRIWESLRAGIYRGVSAGGPAKKALFAFFVSVGGAWFHFRCLLLGLTPQFTRRRRAADILVSLFPFLLLTPLKALGDALVFGKIRAMLGGRFTAGISGGGALPESVDRFFSAVGILVLEGYGLTETSPILGVRLQKRPVPGTIGPAYPGTELFIVHPETREELPPGEKGLILARGKQVMQGYYKRPEETAGIIDSRGRLDTGDLGMKTWTGEVKITGRAKDTIVLLGGENVEPVPIEARIRESEYIEHAVVLGQDQKHLAALIVPDFERLEAYGRENSLPWQDRETLTGIPQIRELIGAEIAERVNRKTGFRGFETIWRFTLLPRTFELGRELSGKQDYKRHVINDIYGKEIRDLFSGADSD